MERLLLVHPRIAASGGGNAVAAWAIEALRARWAVTLAAFEPVDLAAVNAAFGCSLREGDFALRLAPERWRRAFRALPTRSALLKCCLSMRFVQEIEDHFDVVLATQNEVDLHRRAIQYVHWPWSDPVRPQADLRWYHGVPGTLSSYRWACAKVARATQDGLRRNVTIANSAFTAARVKEVLGVDARVLYPPVPGGAPLVPWEAREEAFIAVGRMTREKRWEAAVHIVEGLRARGRDVGLTIAGHAEDEAYADSLRALAASRPWLRVVQDLHREDLAALMRRHRYGLHTMEDEPFGIAPAELLRAGCVPWVHASGGPREIVADARLCFTSEADAVARISPALEDAALLSSLRASASSRAHAFSTSRFCAELRQVVEAF